MIFSRVVALCRVCCNMQAEGLAHQQYRVAMRLGDLALARRCQFFVIWSTIQRREFAAAMPMLICLVGC